MISRNIDRANANGANESSTSYLNLSRNVYGLFFDVLASRTQRRLEYWKAVWEISLRPYQSASGESTLREAFSRTDQILQLTANEITVVREKVADLSEKLVSYSAKFRDLNENFAGVAGTSRAKSSQVPSEATGQQSISKSGRNSYYVEEAAQHQSNGGTNRTEEVKRRTAAATKPPHSDSEGGT